MTTAGDIMHRGAQWIPAHETLDRAAQLMRELGVGALPISDENERLCGILTDRDIVIGCVAVGHDPSKVTAGEMAQGTPRWIDANADISDVLREMKEHQIRRLPVIDDKRLVGMISEADLARHLSEGQIAHWAESVYATSGAQKRR
ncbi:MULTISPECIES: CBS domain-containing protein [Streptomyces]|uniref:CBS domain-containing protein n=2 Tax=Streptomyces TaxID=1883 RepID=A0A3Q9ERB9_9ACTN|nr:MULTISPECIES: CBS domain-containing protein [Streptomyces]AZQ34012.1 CBS domain-containing protein [Streptomyces cyaneochromogenes]MCL8010712.1 CBS domain-containing protein [Streptomyces sp. AS02]